MKLILTEKPSVARDFAKALKLSKKDGYFEGNGYVVTWAFGHLYELARPEDYNSELKKWSWEGLPIIPSSFKRIPKDASSRKQIKVIKQLLSKASEVIVGTDAEREGELIAREILEECGWKGKTWRFWTSLSLTPDVVKKTLKNLKPAKNYDRLYHAALARQQADWLVGMNLSRAATLAFGKKELFSIGRVQTAVLAILVKRYHERVNFKPKPYWLLKAILEKDGKAFTASWIGGQIFEKEKAYNLLEKVKSAKEARVIKVERKRQKTGSPYLYDLITLQQDAAKKFGFSSKKTLSIAQKLYEVYKCLSYPRTESRFMGKDNFNLVKDRLFLLSSSYPEIFRVIDKNKINPGYKRVFNDAGLTDHHALIPLAPLPDEASPDEKKIYELVLKRFAAAFSEDYVYENTYVELEIAGEKFKATGKIDLKKGWTEIFIPAKEEDKDKEEEENNKLPDLIQGETVKKIKEKLRTKMTQPPSEYTESSLLAVMKNPALLVEDTKHKEIFKDRGLGTQATRADIIETLIKRNYVQRKGKKLIPTQKGIFLINQLSKLGKMKALTEPAETARWEGWLAEIAQGNKKANGFLEGINRLIKDCIDELKKQEAKYERKKETLGKCPLCGGDVFEGKKSYYCSSWKEKNCEFKIWKQLYGKNITPSIARELLTKKITKKLKFKSKAGKTFQAKLKLLKDGKIELVFD